MLSSATIPRRFAVELLDTLNAIRGETATFQLTGVIAVSADDLLDGAEGVQGWLADLAHVVECGADDLDVVLPAREVWALQQIVYAVSSVLVWAHSLREDGRLRTVVTLESLSAWEHIEHLAGLGGRTARALGIEVRTLRRIRPEMLSRRHTDILPPNPEAWLGDWTNPDSINVA